MLHENAIQANVGDFDCFSQVDDVGFIEVHRIPCLMVSVFFNGSITDKERRGRCWGLGPHTPRRRSYAPLIVHTGAACRLPKQNVQIDKTSVCAKVGYALHPVYARAQDGPSVTPLGDEPAVYCSE